MSSVFVCVDTRGPICPRHLIIQAPALATSQPWGNKRERPGQQQQQGGEMGMRIEIGILFPPEFDPGLGCLDAGSDRDW